MLEVCLSLLGAPVAAEPEGARRGGGGGEGGGGGGGGGGGFARPGADE
eukprot:SAG31_NODE_831_length_11669_cov_3.410026_11_plen_48_part_00